MEYLTTGALDDMLNGPISGNISALANSAFHFDFDHGPQVQAGNNSDTHSLEQRRQRQREVRGLGEVNR